MKLLMVILFLLSSFFAHADYFKLHRNTWIKEEAKSSGALVKKVVEGEFLMALDSAKQTNGYYHVKYPASNFTGYIYRTLVQRISGDFPVFYNTTNAVDITIIDVGPAMSAFIKLPNGKVIVYDAGAYKRTFEYIKEKDPQLEEIEYLILSHTDADHWGSVKSLAENYTLKNVLRTDYRKSDRSKTLDSAVAAINIAQDVDISKNPIHPGTLVYNKHGVELYFMMGFGDLDFPSTEEWEKLSASKKNKRCQYCNKTSIWRAFYSIYWGCSWP